MRRNRKGQSALEYAALITVLAAVVVFLIWGTNSQNNLRGKVENTYNSALDKVDTAKGWVDATMGGGGQTPQTP